MERRGGEKGEERRKEREREGDETHETATDKHDDDPEVWVYVGEREGEW